MKAIRKVLAAIRKADQEYNLINHNDKIVVGLSGGKDSLALLYALTLYQKFSHTDFQIQPVTLDLGFPGFDKTPLEKFCKNLGLELIVSDSKEVYKILKLNQNNHAHLPCSICSRMKKAAINKVAKEIGYNKVAFAHHADDAIETLFMNELFGGRVATFSPKMHLEKADIVFIRPLILVREKDIQSLMKEMNFEVIDSHCPADKFTKREEIKSLMNSLYKQYPMAKENCLKMISNYKQYDLWGQYLTYQIDNCGLTIKECLSSNDSLMIHHIRHEVFVKEYGISYDDEFVLNEEKDATSYLIELKGKPIGTIRYRFVDEKCIKVERFAILKDYRNKGYGGKTFDFLIDMLWKEYNPVTFIIHSMEQYVSFYEKHGFIKQKTAFVEVNIKHYLLSK